MILVRGAGARRANSPAAQVRRFKASVKEAGLQGTLSGTVKLAKVLHFKIGGKEFFRRVVHHPTVPESIYGQGIFGNRQ